MIPPKHNADFVAAMEDVLDVYQRPYDPMRPVVCMDEQPVQLVQETRVALPTGPGVPLRYDYEYERRGTANHFLFTEPLAGWRKVSVRPRKTKTDWAQEIQQLLDVDYPNADKVILVCDNLNTHKIASLYEAFDPAQARRLAQRLEIHFTPKHGSWLNIAEIELSVLTRQTLGRPIPDVTTLAQQAHAWQTHRNRQQKAVHWQFTTDDARIKLKRLYPQYQD